MHEATFVVRDISRRKSKPCAFISYRPDRGYVIDIDPDVLPEDAPAFFVPFIERRQLRIEPDLAMRWIRERIPPSGRQNIGEILRAHGLSEYDELALLRSTHGESSQDSFAIEEVDNREPFDGGLDKRKKRRELLGARVKEKRIASRMSQKDLADKLGIDQPALSRIESGATNVTFDLLADIDEALNADDDSILNYKREGLHGSL